MKIELPEVEGYEWVEVSKGEYYAYEGNRSTLMFSPPFPFKYFIQRPVKKLRLKKLYRWSKTHGDVLVEDQNGVFYFNRDSKTFSVGPFQLAEGVWQAHTSGKCPVDPDATYVAVRFTNLKVSRGVAGDFGWAKDGGIIYFTVIGLVEGYSYA